MRYIVSEHAQGTQEWLQDRAGKATGSKANAIRSFLKDGKESAARRDYRIELALERLTGQAAEQEFTTKEMQRGTEQEPYARMAFEDRTGLFVSESGFVFLPDVMAGCSVDGFIKDGGRLGIWESKSPKSFTHINYIKAGILPDDYRPQVIHNMWITGAEFADFFSYDSRMPEELQCFHVRIDRDQAEIDAHEQLVLQFLREVDQECAALLALTETVKQRMAA
jgi:hypothetical protein